MKILIIDDESDIVEIVSFFVEEKFSGDVNIQTASGGFEAIEILKNGDIDLCICDHNMPKGRGCEVFRFIDVQKLKTKFVLCSSTLPSDLIKEYGSNTIYSNIVKPDIEKGIDELSKMILQDLKPKEAGDTDKSEYIPLMISLLFIIGKLPCDLYVHLSDKKYVKCLNSGEAFSDYDRDKYLEKNITKLFAKRGDGETVLLKLVNDALVKSINYKQKSIEERMLDVHIQLNNLLKIFGISEELTGLSKNLINQIVLSLIKNEKIFAYWEKVDLYGEYPSKLFTLQSILCGIAIKKINWGHEAALEKLVTAAFYQDLTLDSIKLMMFIDQDDFLSHKDSLSTKEIKNFLEHPFRSKQLLSKIRDLPADIEKIVLEQHEMPHGEGFPHQLVYSQVGSLSAIFNLSGILAKHILKDEAELNGKELFNNLEIKGFNKGKYKEIFICYKSLFTKVLS